MATHIRLARYGAKKRPYYRIVVTDHRTPSGRRKLDQVGTYDPRTEPVALQLDAEKIRKWLEVGAQPSQTVAQLIKKSGVLEGAETPAAVTPAAEAAPAAEAPAEAAPSEA